jgi:uncharacterized protein (TIGR00251 family)
VSPFYLPTSEGYLLRLTVVPGASRTEVVGLHGDRLKLRVAAAPEKGAANRTLLEFLAKRLGLPKKAVRLSGGEHSREKTVEVLAPSPDLAAHLQDLLPRKRLSKLDKQTADDKN